METELCKLALKYGTDKCPKIKHHYTPYYYELFKDIRESVKKVFEMGVGFKEDMKHAPSHYKPGASLFMWRDFFPNAQIYGADILPELVFKEDRVETFQCDQTKKEDLQNLIKKTGTDIDIFIDDGSHVTEDQAFTCLTVLPLLKKDVIYIIEDVNDPHIGEGYFQDYNSQVVETKPTKGFAFWDDRLVIVKNENNSINSNL
jgi:hypothetical protein